MFGISSCMCQWKFKKSIGRHSNFYLRSTGYNSCLRCFHKKLEHRLWHLKGRLLHMKRSTTKTWKGISMSCACWAYVRKGEALSLFYEVVIMKWNEAPVVVLHLLVDLSVLGVWVAIRMSQFAMIKNIRFIGNSKCPICFEDCVNTFFTVAIGRCEGRLFPSKYMHNTNKKRQYSWMTSFLPWIRRSLFHKKKTTY